MKKINAERLAGPRCGARRKRDGEPCQQLVLYPNGRCKFHGGKTPKGKDWHKIQLPAADAGADALARKERMIVQRQKKRAATRAAKLTAMTPEQRAAYDNQFAKRVMNPGPATRRASIRKQRADAKAFREIVLATEAAFEARNHAQADRGAESQPAASPGDPSPISFSPETLRKLFP
ncbi:HGGxSTG domain-containing protein [Methylocella silvestris]